MSKPLKFVLFGVAGLATLLIGLVVVGLNLDPNLFKGQIAKTIKATTGLEVAFDGPISTSYFPSLGVSLSQVTVNAPKEAGGGVLARLGQAQVSLGLGALVAGRVEAGEMRFDGLEVNLVRDENGKLNLPAPPVKEVKLEQEKVVVITLDDQRYAFDYQIEAVKLVNSTLRYQDKQSGNAVTLSGLALSTGKVTRGQLFPVSLGFDYLVAVPDASGRVDLSGQAWAIPEAMQFAFENASFKTSMTSKGLPVKQVQAEYTGTVRADVNKQSFKGKGLKLAVSARGGVLPEAGASGSLVMDVLADMAAGTALVKGMTLESMGFSLSGDIQAANLNQAAQVSMAMATNEFNPRQVLEKFGVSLPQAPPGAAQAQTVKASFKLKADAAADTAELSDVTIRALGLDVTCQAQASSLQKDPRVKGRVNVAEFNPRQVLANLGQPLPAMADASALTRLRLAYAFESHGGRFTLRSEGFQLDNTALQLSLEAVQQPTARLNFALKADQLDADRYMPKEAKADEKAKGQTKGGKESPGKGVGAEVTGTVEIGSLKAAKLAMRNVSARIHLKDDILDINPASLNLYGGSLKATVRAGLSGGPSAPLALTANAEGLNVEGLLNDLTGKAQLTGRASLNAQVTARGEEARQILSSMNGRASFALRNGAVLGFDLSPDVFSSAEKLKAQGSGGARTNYEVISGSFVIQNGVATGNDLLASVPPHKVTGQGSVNLAAETLDYKVQASFAKLPPIPVRLTGAMASPSVSVDAASLATGVAKGVVEGVVKNPQEIIKNPQDIIKKPQDLGKGAMDAIGNILGGQKKQ